MDTVKAVTGVTTTVPAESEKRIPYSGANVLPFDRINNEHNKNYLSSLSAQRVEFVEILNQEFLLMKGYGVYTYLSAIDVILLFEQFLNRGISAKSFAKEYIRSL